MASTLRRRSRTLRSAIDVTLRLAQARLDPGALGWSGPGAEAFAALHADQIAAYERSAAELERAAAELEHLASDLDEVGETMRAWDRRVGDAAERVRRIEGHLDPIGRAGLAAAIHDLEEARVGRRRATELAEAGMEATDRDVARVLADLAWWRPPHMRGPIPIPGLASLVSSVGLFSTLSQVQRAHLATTRPQVVGADPGAPLALRYRSNLEAMERYALGALNERIASVRLDETALGRHPGAAFLFQSSSDLLGFQQRLLARVEEGRQFLVFDPEGDGRLVEVFGSLDSAEHIAVVVPGITNSQFDYDLGFARDVARVWGGDEAIAAIAWLGYDTPGSGPSGTSPLTPDALSVTAAAEGAADLRRFVDWLVAQRPDAHVTVVGHSYGSVVAGTAASAGLAAHDLVLVGSPGVPLNHAGAARLSSGGRVWAALADGDPIAGLGDLTGYSTYPDDAAGNPFSLVHGVNPVHEDFGARRLDPFPDRGHSAYFTVAGAAAIRRVVKRPRPEPPPRR